MPVSFAPVTGTHLRLVVDRVRAVTTPDPSTHQPVALPVAIAETGLGGVPVPASPAEIPSVCRTDLVTVDGVPLDVRVTGGVTPAEARRGLDLTACDGQPLALAAGRHVVRSARGAATGLDVDRLVLGSDRGGGPLPPGPLGARRITSGARARVTDSGPTHVDARVRTDGRPFWLVLGQSRNDGWELDVDGAHAGPARLVNGYANGWEITPASAGDLAVHLRWTPQRLVWWGIGASIVGILLCLVLALRRRRGAAEPPVVPEGAVDAAPGLASPLRSGGAAPPTRVVVLAAVGGALVAGVASRPWVGLVVGVAAGRRAPRPSRPRAAHRRERRSLRVGRRLRRGAAGTPRLSDDLELAVAVRGRRRPRVARGLAARRGRPRTGAPAHEEHPDAESGRVTARTTR